MMVTLIIFSVLRVCEWFGAPPDMLDALKTLRAQLS